MSVKLTPTIDECKSKFQADYSKAMEEQSNDLMVQAHEEYAEAMCRALLAEHESMSATERADAEILASRGVRQLTAEETNYYNAVIAAMRSSTGQVKNALTDLDVAMPETIIDEVMEDVKSEFPLLDAIDFVNASYLTSWIYNKQGVQTATWGTIGGAIQGELSGAFGKLSVTQCKLTAYMVVSQDYLDLGPAWLDHYVRAVLTEAMGMSMEAAIVDGEGNSDGAACPIGMTRDLDSGTTADDLTTYARKEAIAVTALDPETYGTILAGLSKTPTDRNRKVGDVILVCNPEDYFTKVMPATTMLIPGGGYANNVLPYPTKIFQSEGCPSGYAVVGIAKQYIGLLGVGSKRGTITYDDSVQFLEDNRVYKSRMIGNGRPKDNLSFVLLDISGLEPLTYRVTSVSSDSTAEG